MTPQTGVSLVDGVNDSVRTISGRNNVLIDPFEEVLGTTVKMRKKQDGMIGGRDLVTFFICQIIVKAHYLQSDLAYLS